jgi:hypothetical protein
MNYSTSPVSVKHSPTNLFNINEDSYYLNPHIEEQKDEIKSFFTQNLDFEIKIRIPFTNLKMESVSNELRDFLYQLFDPRPWRRLTWNGFGEMLDLSWFKLHKLNSEHINNKSFKSPFFPNPETINFSLTRGEKFDNTKISQFPNSDKTKKSNKCRTISLVDQSSKISNGSKKFVDLSSFSDKIKEDSNYFDEFYFVAEKHRKLSVS